MYAVTGITGQVGSTLGKALLASGKQVRAVVRAAEKGEVWKKQGCDVAIATMEDPEALAKAFSGMEGVFILLPPYFDPAPGFPEARSLIANIRQALEIAKPVKVVCLSTIGAQAEQPNLLNQLQVLEHELRKLPMPVAFLRAAWFMENSAWDVEPARNTGIIPSFLQPLDRKIPMVATADIGHVASTLLQQNWNGVRIIELEGPEPISPNDVAASFSQLIGKPVSMKMVPRDSWDALFRSQGMLNPLPRIQMLDGFNAGWIKFESDHTEHVKGQIPLRSVLGGLLKMTAPQ